MKINLLKYILIFGLGFFLAFFLLDGCNNDSITINSDTSHARTIINTSDTTIFSDDTLSLSNIKEVNDSTTKPKIIYKSYPVYIDTNDNDTVYCVIPIKEYSDTITKASAKAWYYAKVEGELKEIDIKVIPYNKLIKDSTLILDTFQINTTIQNKKNYSGLYVGLGVGTDFKTLNSLSVPVQFVTKKNLILGYNFQYNIVPNNFSHQFTLTKKINFKK